MTDTRRERVARWLQDRDVKQFGHAMGDVKPWSLSDELDKRIVMEEATELLALIEPQEERATTEQGSQEPGYEYNPETDGPYFNPDGSGVSFSYLALCRMEIGNPTASILQWIREAKSTLSQKADEEGGWRILEEGEVIQGGDEVDRSPGWNDEPQWWPATRMGEKAPNPRLPAHRQYRRPLTYATQEAKDDD